MREPINLEYRIVDLMREAEKGVGPKGWGASDAFRDAVKQLLRDVLDEVKPKELQVMYDYARDELPKHAEPDRTIELGRRRAIDELEVKIERLGL